VIHHNDPTLRVVFINDDGATDLTPYMMDMHELELDDEPLSSFSFDDWHVCFERDEPAESTSCFTLVLGAAVLAAAAWWYGKVAG